jgi:hypothetical protein
MIQKITNMNTMYNIYNVCFAQQIYGIISSQKSFWKYFFKKETAGSKKAPAVPNNAQ